MRDRTVLIVHEKRDARAPLPFDLVAVADTLRARELDPLFAYVASAGANVEPADIGDIAARAATAKFDDTWLRERLAHAMPLRDFDGASYGAVVVCDHGRGLPTLAADASFARVVRACARSARPLVAIARAPRALAAIATDEGAPYLAGRRVTHARAPSECASDRRAAATRRDLVEIAEAVRDSGADVRFEDVGAEHVVVDTYLLSAQNVRSAASAARTIAAYAPSRSFARRRAG